MTDNVVLGKPILNPLPVHRFIRTVLDRLCHPNAQALLQCWREHEANGGMRMGRDIPSRALAKLLPDIIIAEPIGCWDDARIRLAGTALMERFGRDGAGELTRKLYAGDRDGATLLLKLARDAAEIRKPGMIDLRILSDEIEVFHIETVLLPIFAPQGSACWAMVGAFRF